MSGAWHSELTLPFMVLSERLMTVFLCSYNTFHPVHHSPVCYFLIPMPQVKMEVIPSTVVNFELQVFFQDQAVKPRA